MTELDPGADGRLDVEPPIRVVGIRVRVEHLWLDSDAAVDQFSGGSKPHAAPSRWCVKTWLVVLC